MTLLATALAAVAFAPIATILVQVALPAFTAALPAYYVLMPGTVALAVTRVVGSYIAGLGKTGTVSLVTIGSFVVNVVANVLLILRSGSSELPLRLLSPTPLRPWP